MTHSASRLLRAMLGFACVVGFTLTLPKLSHAADGKSSTTSASKSEKKAKPTAKAKAPKKAKAEKKEKSKEKTDKALPKSCSGLKNKIADEKDAQRYPTDVKKAAERDQFINRMESKLSRECK